MNIDSLTNIISAMTVPEFRTLSLDFLKKLGYLESNITDGPYDGTKDYKLLYTSSGEKSISIAMSTTPNWRKKILDDISNMKRKNPRLSNVFYLSSKRMPERSFSNYQEKIVKEQNVFVIKYDCQTIASTYIKENSINTILNIANINIPSNNNKGTRKLLNKNIAISSLLLFSDDANELRKSFFESIIETEILKSKDALTRDSLIEKIIDEYSFEQEQFPYISSQFDRLLQMKKISTKKGLYYLKEEDSKSLQGIESQFNLEFLEVEKQIKIVLNKSKISFSNDEMEDLLENIEDFILGLVRESLGLKSTNVNTKGSYSYIRTLIEEKYSKTDGSEVIKELLEIVSQSTFAKRIASTEMIIDLFNLNSNDLLNVFKAEKSISIYLDTSIVIPLLCSLLWGEFSSRYSYSANKLYELVSNRGFELYIMDKHLEEVASHLINAGRIYRVVEKIDEPLISQNAFITHYSMLRKIENITFSEYLEIFNIKPSDIPEEEIEMKKFIKGRQIIEHNMIEILKTYNIKTITSENPRGYDTEIENLKEIRIDKGEILLKHDASVINYLSQNIDGNSKVLCTWDRSLIEYKNKYPLSFSMLSPIALIDFMSMVKGETKSYPLASYVNFAKLQSEQMLEISSSIWDILIQIEKDELLDAKLIVKARNFQNNYTKKYHHIEELDQTKISKDWLAWKEI